MRCLESSKLSITREGSYPWPTRDPTQTDHNFSSHTPNTPILIPNILFSESMCERYTRERHIVVINLAVWSGSSTVRIRHLMRQRKYRWTRSTVRFKMSVYAKLPSTPTPLQKRHCKYIYIILLKIIDVQYYGTSYSDYQQCLEMGSERRMQKRRCGSGSRRIPQRVCGENRWCMSVASEIVRKEREKKGMRVNVKLACLPLTDDSSNFVL